MQFNQMAAPFSLNSTFVQLTWWPFLFFHSCKLFCLSEASFVFCFVSQFPFFISYSVFCFSSFEHQWKRIWPNPMVTSFITGLSQPEWGSGVVLFLGTDADHWAGSCSLWYSIVPELRHNLKYLRVCLCEKAKLSWAFDERLVLAWGAWLRKPL